MKSHLIKPYELKIIWHDVYPLIKAACEYNGGRYDALDIMEEIQKGAKQLWLALDGEAIKGIAVTQLIPFPRKQVCSIHICTGEDLAQWGYLQTDIESWAKEQGCVQMFNVARAGMKKLLHKHGYSMTHCFFEKDL